MKKLLKNWQRRRQLLRRLDSQLNEAVGMHWWGRAYNICDRIDRVKGRAYRGRITHYFDFKQSFATSCGWPSKWRFDPYTLT